MLEQASFETVHAKHEHIRSQGLRLTNMMLDSYKLREVLQQKQCFFFYAENCLFILIPFHNSHYDVLYLATDEQALKNAIVEFLASYKEKKILRLSVIGKEPMAEKTANLFVENGFTLGKCLARTTVSGESFKAKKAISDLVDEDIQVGFAKEEHAEQILDILLENFDISSDNIPELEEIRTNIKKNQIVAIIINNQVASFIYYEIINNMLFSYYDVTRKEYRNRFLLLYIGNFLADYFKEKQKVKRAFAWRDKANKRLIKYAALNNEFPDGVYLYNMSWQLQINKVM